MDEHTQKQTDRGGRFPKSAFANALALHLHLKAEGEMTGFTFDNDCPGNFRTCMSTSTSTYIDVDMYIFWSPSRYLERWNKACQESANCRLTGMHTQNKTYVSIYKSSVQKKKIIIIRDSNNTKENTTRSP